ncbi:MAG: hypothetical protein K2M34_01720 [Alphaproteobacteria bacterium]|nr:hypothetical protein [Alphaproteobacteria bacterium]
MKKLLSFVCCLLPFSAGAVTTIIEHSPGAGASYGGDGSVTSLTVGATEAVVITNGNGIVISKPASGTSIGLTVPNNLIIGQDNSGSTGGDLFAAAGTDPVFTIQSDGNVSVGALLQVLSGRTLGITTKTTGTLVDASFGSIDAVGALNIQNIDKFTSGNIDSATALTISANTITAGAIEVTGGTTDIDATGAIKMTQFQTNGTTTTIDAASIESGNIQNSNANGNMTIKLTGDLNAKDKSAISNSANIGSIENSGTSMKITAQNVNVAGTMKNDSNDGTLTMNVASLKVTGGTATNRSLVNAGNLNLTVTGETNLAQGFDLSRMKNTNEFYLKTGTLKFGSVDAADAGDAWLQVFANDLNKFYLEITGGKVNAGTILNGANNSSANMTVIGQSVAATSVTNKGGTLLVKGTSNASTDSVNITGAVQGDAGTTTDIISAGILNVGGTVSNSGTMQVNGNDVRLVGVSNDGTQLKISSLTDDTGKIKITSTVTNNAGDLIVNARQIDIDGNVKNVSGTTDIKGSDASDGAAVTLGGIDVQGGQFKLDALIGDVSVDNAISVTGGVLNIGQNTHNVTAGKSVQINGNVNVQGTAPTTGSGDVNIAATGASGFILSSTPNTTDGSITIDGTVSAIDASVARSAQFDAKTITVAQDVTASNKGKLIFGSAERSAQTATNTTITGNATANNGGTLEFYSDDTDVGTLSVDKNSLLVAHGSQITATAGAITINGNVWFNPDEEYTAGMLVKDTNNLTLKTVVNNADIDIKGGVTINDDANTLTLNSARDVTIVGRVTSDGALSVTAAHNATFNNAIETNKSLEVFAQNITTQGIENTGDMVLGNATNVADTITTGAITNSGTVEINGTTVKTAAIESTDGSFDVTADSLNSTFVTVSGGTATLDVKTIVATNDIDVSGSFVQGKTSTSNAGMMNIVRDNATVSADDFHVGSFSALNNTVSYDFAGDITVDNNFAVSNGATVEMAADGDMTLTNGALTNAALTNAGNLTLTVGGTGGLNIDGAIENTGDLTLSALNGDIKASSFTVNTGTTHLIGHSMTLTGAFGAADKSSMLYHGGIPTLNAGDFFIENNGYTLTASNVALAGIKQATTSNGLTLKTSDLKVKNDIDVVDMRVAANPANNWLKVDVGGNLIGGAQFIGLESMHIGGNYKFTNKSQINAAILPYAKEVGPNTTTTNYWSTISLNDDNTLGQITNKADGAALIQVDGAFISAADDFDVAVNNGKLATPQIGLILYDVVDQGTAIWLLHANEGVSDESLTAKIRNLNVSFCNDSGTLCLDYLEAINKYNNSNTDLPAYISVRDSAGDGFADSLYVVFDPRFGGPVEVFKIQPIVGRVDDHTAGEYGAAGAWDDLIAGQLAATGFYNRTPIEVIPLIFKNTNMSTAADELYKRMEYYNLERDGDSLARFSRLFQPREVEQLAGSVSLNEHTNFRSFEDRMFDEFIWNRHRNLKKAWLDVDYGMFYQDATDGKHIDGNRFNIAGGYDWQESQTLLLGLTGRVSRMSSDNFDDIDLGYLPGQHIAGNVKTSVSDTDIGLGGYLMKILGQKTRIYGNGFLDIHMLDVDRDQTFVSKISGSGTVFSLMSEWGLLHDWLNQYVVGNMYARAGYTTGLDITEKAAGQDYMKLESDGYFTFTPGYSLTAQKRIYPSVWFQVRPYATIGVEYDVLGAPDSVKYKFAAANSYTTYDINIDPLWANIGGGVEMLSVTGVQVGIDYRYQYNADMQLHNIRVSGSYRF